jgi:hypothetical protein
MPACTTARESAELSECLVQRVHGRDAHCSHNAENDVKAGVHSKSGQSGLARKVAKVGRGIVNGVVGGEPGGKV